MLYVAIFLYLSLDRDKETKKSSLAKAYRTLMQNMWSNDPPSSIAPTSVLYAVKLVFAYILGQI